MLQKPIDSYGTARKPSISPKTLSTENAHSRTRTTSTLRVLDGIATPTSNSVDYVLLHTDEQVCKLRATAAALQYVLTWSCTFATEH